MKIAVHDGTFHADDAFAVAIIEMIYPDFELVRTRDEDILKKCEIRIDVGNKNNPDTGDFDHHLPEGAGERKNGIPYAACGLIWKHFGKKAAGSDYIYNYIERKLIQGIDAIDCGYDPGLEDLDFQLYNISDLIDSFNRVWYEEENDNLENFKSAVSVASDVLKNEIKRAKGFEDSVEFVKDAVFNATNPHYVVLEKYCPWQDVIISETDMFYVIFPSMENEWRIRAVPVQKGSFIARKDLPSSWAGRKNEILAEITGVSDATFCHPARFIAGAKSLEGAIKLTELALGN